MAKFVKESLKKEYDSYLDGVTDCLVVDIATMPADATADLRNHLRENGISMKVVLNRVAHKSLADGPMESLTEHMKGMSALVHGAEDIVTLAKTVVDWRKKHKNAYLKITAALVDGEILDAKKFIEVSKMPGKLQLRGMLVSCIAAPMVQLMNVLQGPGRGIVYALNARKEQLEGDEG